MNTKQAFDGLRGCEGCAILRARPNKDDLYCKTCCPENDTESLPFTEYSEPGVDEGTYEDVQ